jgi:CelD/BcsL family acetyltransferase involved in cellulose biosynthesis
MQITRITTFDQLQALAPDWNRLAGEVPFRTWQWLHCWWRSYGAANDDARCSKSLYVLAVHDEKNELIGIAPWFVQSTLLSGNVVRMLGSGEVCSDYLSLLVEPEHQQPVTAAIADWLSKHHSTDNEHRWDTIELDGIDADDTNIAAFSEACGQRQLKVHRQAGPNFWRLELPSTWEAYLAMQSKSHRKQLRRLERRTLENPTARLHFVHSRDDLERAWPVLKRLHQLRRQSLGQRGCFESGRFENFQDLAVGPLLDAGCLEINILELDGKPVAAEYDLAMGDIVYAYQSGLDPTRLSDEPGSALQMAVLQRAIREGRKAFDFLRGDEPYKAHWRATERPSIEVRIAPKRIATTVRSGIFDASAGVKQWIKSGLTTAGLYS